MKIGGKNYQARSKEVSVKTLSGEVVLLTIEPLPPGFMEQEPEVIPEPKCPRRWATKPGNDQKLLRDPQTKSPIAVADEENPKYQQARFRMVRARTARAIFTALANDPSVEFETDRNDYASATSYYYAVAEELEACGLGLAQQMTLLEAILDLSGLSVKEAVEEGLETFHDKPDRGAAGGEPSQG